MLITKYGLNRQSDELNDRQTYYLHATEAASRCVCM